MAYTKESIDKGAYYRISKEGVYIGSHTVASATLQKAGLTKRKTEFQKAEINAQKAVNLSAMDLGVSEMDKIIALIGT